MDLKNVVSDVNTIKKGNQGDNILVKGQKYVYKDESQKDESLVAVLHRKP